MKSLRIRFSLKTLFGLTTLVSIVLGLVIVLRGGEQQRQHHIQSLEERLDLWITYDYEESESAVPGPQLLRLLLGKNYFADVVSVNNVGNPHSKAVNDEDVEYIVSNFPKLRYVTLWGEEELTDRATSKLTRLKFLRTARLVSDETTDVSLRHLSNCPKLEYVVIGGSGISNQGLVHLKNLSKLKILDLDCTSITDDGLREIAKIPCLDRLSISGSPITADGIRHLTTQGKKLKTFSLRDCQLTDEALEPIGRMSQLQRLNLDCNPITSRGIEKLANLKNLEELWISSTNLDHGALNALCQMQKLAVIDYNTGTPGTWQTLRKQFPSLTIYALETENGDSDGLKFGQ